METSLASLEVLVSTLPRPDLIQKLSLLLLKCRKQRNVVYARRLYDYTCRHQLDSDASLGNFLVPLLAHVGLISDAHQVFNKLVRPNDCTWNFLIIAYAKCGNLNLALVLYEQMVEDCAQPNVGAFVALLKACSKMQNGEKGLKLHAEICRKGLDRDPFILSILVDMYAKCNFLEKAQEVFDNSPSQDVVMWTTLISGYVKHGDAKKALCCFERMRSDGIHPNIVTYFCSLKSCGILQDIGKCQELHAEIARRGFGNDSFIGSSLIDVYVKFCLLKKAQDVFDKLPIRDTVSYNALIAGYATQGHGEDALKYFEIMEREGLTFTNFTYASILKACSSIGAVDKAHSIHTDISKKGLQDNIVIGNALVDMYVTLGLLENAQKVFDVMTTRDVISWTALIGGHAKQGHGKEALKYFEEMQIQGIKPNVVTYVCSLIACSSSGDIERGENIYAEIARQGLEEDLLVGSTLVDMYAKCGSLAKAQEVFDALQVRDVVCWNALQAGYYNHGYEEEALDCFERMQVENLHPDAVTIICSLKGCANLGAVRIGQGIHDILIRNSFLEKDIVVGNALVEMYAKCGFLANAIAVFEKLPNRDVMSWNAIIIGYIQNGQVKTALGWFERMQSEGVFHDIVTFVCILKACHTIGSIEKGKEIHVIITQRALETNLLVGNALIDMYASCGLICKAQEVFDKLLPPDIISWTSLLSGLVKYGCAEEALDCFEQMQLKDLILDAVVYVCVLKACGIIGAIEKGQHLHAEITRLGLEVDLVVGNSLIDIYANCGMLMEASEVFWHLLARDIISYTALLSGYAQLGESEGVSKVLNTMTEDKEHPNPITFVSVLNACSHSGLVDVGQVYFEAMKEVYDMIPDVEHYTCMIDIFGRAGQLEKAIEIIEKMPFHPNLWSCHSFLGACRKWNDADLGKRVFEHAMSLDENDAAVYICMHNIYADTSYTNFCL